jgi:hypothetical protein
VVCSGEILVPATLLCIGSIGGGENVFIDFEEKLARYIRQ